MPDFAKHLPPSAGLPRVLALDAASAAALPPEAEATLAGPEGLRPGSFDAVVGFAGPAGCGRWLDLLRPGGRVILVAGEDPQTLLDALSGAGYIHCLVEPEGDLSLYRGERPPTGAPLDRIARLDSQPADLDRLPPFLYLLVSQTPNKPAWKIEPGEPIRWQAATAVNPRTGRTELLVFGSLVKAVAFMQPAVLARAAAGVNKIGKFPSALVRSWDLPFVLNPGFDEWRTAALQTTVDVDPQAAIAGEGG
jgi:hypothetical protein